MDAYFRELWRQTGFYLPRAASGLLMLLSFLYLSRILERLVLSVSEKSPPGKRYVLKLAAQIISVGLKGLGLISALGAMNINISALVAGLGLTGFALGFALKDAISNLLSGCLIMIYQPFQRGQKISVTGLEGVVSNIDMRYTTLTADGKAFLIPNSTMLNNPITVVKEPASLT
jgi:small conductance mechanosensitive channel